MERLTAQWGNNHAVPTKIYLDFMFGLDDDTSQGLTEIFDRLAAYEDTGLEPCDYAAMKAALEQADTAKKDLNELIHIVGAAGVDRLRELVQAEKDGRLVVLPWAIGQTIYEADPDHGVVKHTLKNAILDMESTAVDDAGNTWPDFWCSDDESLAHMTREEAEAALAKQKEKQK